MGLIDRYILRTVATPLIIALCIAGMLLLLEHMLRLFDFVIAEQGPVDVVWRMLANLVPHYLGLALPLGTFIGILLAFRNLSMSSELDALTASGVSSARLMRPVYVLVVLLMALDFVLVAYLQPYAQYQYKQIRFDVTSGALGIKIPQGEFVDIAENVTIRLGAIDRETREAQDVFLERRRPDGSKTVITATKGAISTTPDIRKLILKLENGRQISIEKSSEGVTTGSSDIFDLELDLPAIGVFRDRGEDDREATLGELLTVLNTESPATSERWEKYRAGFHWRLIHPLTFLVMPILALAMGVSGRRRPSNLKPIAGVAILIVYHELLEEWGKVTAGEGVLSPYISMWGLLAVFTAISLYLYRRSIDQVRTAKAETRMETKPIRVTIDPADESGAPPASPITNNGAAPTTKRRRKKRTAQ